MAQHNAPVTPGISTTRGVPFAPVGAPPPRPQREERIEQEEHKKAKREELRAYGRMLDQKAREEKIKRLEIEKAYRERYQEEA